MGIMAKEDEVVFNMANGHRSAVLLDRENGATSGFSLGISYYMEEDYAPPGIHTDQECFYVVEGEGMAKVGEDEFRILKGCSFLVHPGVLHSIRKLPGCKHVKLAWCHGAA